MQGRFSHIIEKYGVGTCQTPTWEAPLNRVPLNQKSQTNKECSQNGAFFLKQTVTGCRNHSQSLPKTSCMFLLYKYGLLMRRDKPLQSVCDNIFGMNICLGKLEICEGCIYFSLKVTHLLNTMRKKYVFLKHKLYT